MDGVVLEVDDVHKRFGGLRAITGVSFAVEAGQLLGLIGPNGAGKTTIFNMISGIYRTDRGRIRLRDHDCLLYTSPSPRDGLLSRMPSSA